MKLAPNNAVAERGLEKAQEKAGKCSVTGGRQPSLARVASSPLVNLVPLCFNGPASFLPFSIALSNHHFVHVDVGTDIHVTHSVEIFRRSDQGAPVLNIFDVIALVTFGILVMAVFRGRPCAFFFSANIALVARALGNIERYGQPKSQAFLPAVIFGSTHLEIAKNIFILATVSLVLTQLPLSRPKAVANIRHISFPKPVLALAGLFLAVTAASARPIWEVPYAIDPGRQMVFGMSFFGGVQAVAASIILYELSHRVFEKKLSALKAFFFFLFIFFLTDYAKGRTGFATGYVTLAAMIFFLTRPLKLKRLILVTLGMVAIALAGATIRKVRIDLHKEGTDAIGSAVLSIFETEEGVNKTGEGVESTANGTQYAAHVLECIDIYEQGNSRGWKSLYLPIEYTFKPALLGGLFNFQRTIEAPWELGEYYQHGGGIFVLGELYWNGGYWCVIIGTLFFFGVGRWIDARHRQSPVALLLLCTYGATLLMGFGYGVSQVMRGLINGLLMCGGYALFSRWHFRRSSGPLMQEES